MITASVVLVFFALRASSSSSLLITVWRCCSYMEVLWTSLPTRSKGWVV